MYVHIIHTIEVIIIRYIYIISRGQYINKGRKNIINISIFPD